MNIDIHTEFIDRINKIDWFSDLFGSDVVPNVQIQYYHVDSWNEVKRLHGMIEWEWAITHAKNDLTIYLGSNFPKIFKNTWNVFVDDSKLIMKEILEPALQEFENQHDLDKSFTDFIRWNVLIMIMEDIYRELNPPQFFSSELLVFYESGRLPCGWTDGEWPDGRLAVA